MPTRIAQTRFGDSRVVSVVAGCTISMTVTAEGVLYSWGVGALGHDAMDERVLVPTAVAATLPPGARVGRTCVIPPGHILATCMGGHARLGARCIYQAMPHELFEHIAAAGRRVSGAYLHMGEGLLRLLAVRLRTAA